MDDIYLVVLDKCVVIFFILVDIEQCYDVCVLLVCEFGSCGWGFFLLDSDYDVCFIYVYCQLWYFSVNESIGFGEVQCDVIELLIDDEFDVSGWDLCKVLWLVLKFNLILIEWLCLLIVYWQDDVVVVQLWEVVKFFYLLLGMWWYYFNMVCLNYCGYLCGEMVCIKKYLYVLCLLLVCQWIEYEQIFLLMVFEDLLD